MLRAVIFLRVMNKTKLHADAVQALSLFEARERIADTPFLPGDDARPDGWPEWRRHFKEPAALNAPEDNSPRQVLFEAGLVFAVPLALACLFTVMLP